MGILVFNQSPLLNGSTQDKAEYKGSEKILIPHKSWSCGMVGGIPVPENGALLFVANL
jgi:hypothetical protein